MDLSGASFPNFAIGSENSRIFQKESSKLVAERINDSKMDIADLSLNETNLTTILPYLTHFDTSIKIKALFPQNILSFRFSAGYSPFNDQSFPSFTQFTNLTDLNLYFCRNFFLSDIAKFTQLKSLNLNYTYINSENSNLNLRSLTSLTNLTNLTSLQISSCDVSICHKLTNLTFLALRGCHVDNSDLLQFNLTKLTDLDLASNPHCVNGRSNKKITDVGLAHLTKFTNLTSLDLRNAGKFTRHGFVHLTQLSNLTSLLCTIGNEIPIDVLIKLKNLTYLNFADSLEIKDAHLSKIGELTDLTKLDLSYCKSFTAKGLYSLTKLTRLNQLRLRSSKIEERDLSCLANLFNLSLVSLKSNDGGRTDSNDEWEKILMQRKKK